MKSCDGVIFTHPEPNSGSTYSSAIIGTSRFTNGTTAVLPIRFLYLSSSGFTATAVSPKRVSGRVVEIVKNESSVLYLILHNFPFSGFKVTSRSETADISSVSQLTIRVPL